MIYSHIKTKNEMKNIILSLIALVTLFPISTKADEGMWFLMFIQRLNHRDMQKMGLQLTPDEIYSINNNSLKDAIVQFNGGCTAEVVSKNGLVLTNHHCGFDAITELSTPENNYLKNGYWAKDKSGELKPKSLYVRFFVRMDDCTKRILGKINDQMTELEREAAINKETAVIQKENNGGGKYTVSVRPFFQGNEFYYFVYQDYTDVRLVGTPPESLGKYGGDTDNWEWPRHTADFSMFRIYADANGNPVEYSPNNVPLTPKKHLPINIKGVKEGDFAMILGYPGRTNRWMPAAGIEQNVKYAYPAWVEGSKAGMDAMKTHMTKSEAINLQYTSNYASIANYWKNRQGMIDALTKFKTADIKKANEAKFNSWANKPENKSKYGNVIETINKYYNMTNEKSRHDNYARTALRSNIFLSIGKTFAPQLDKYYKADATTRESIKAGLKESIEEIFINSNLLAEQEIATAQINLYAKKAGYKLAPMVEQLIKTNGGNFTNYFDAVFKNSTLTSKDKLIAFLDNPIDITKDELYLFSNDFIDHFSKKSDDLIKAENDYNKSFRLLVAGMKESGLSSIKYPDANSTLRLTYGKVLSLPMDKRNDAKKNFYTTYDGMVKKYKKGDPEFDMPEKMLEMYKKKEFGKYADKLGHMPINFLTNNDITGGNSGSPVLNGKGELIGLAFDGNIEAMAGDVIFDKKLQRTINCDIRYILWIIDTYSGAKHIVDEMTIIE